MAAEEAAAQIRREMWPEVAAVSATDIRRRMRDGGAK